MLSESALNEQTLRASRAKQILDDELFIGAFQTLEAAYIDAWRSTAVDEVLGREKLFLAINVVGKVRQHLQQVISDGKVAEVDLRELARTPERKKRWDEV